MLEYSLTERGKSLFHILSAMYDWGAELMEKEGIHPECSMTGRTSTEVQGLCEGKCKGGVR